MTATFQIEPLASTHERLSFQCEVEPLDRYFRQQVTQDIRRRVASCHVAVDALTGKVAGYYTLAAGSIPLSDVPGTFAKRLPRYPHVPVARLGRLAVDAAYRGRGIGATLLWDAAFRALKSGVTVFALVVDAKDEQAEAFYRHHDFTLLSNGNRQFMFCLSDMI